VKCAIAGCPGAYYEARTFVHRVKQRGGVIVIDHVPAGVGNVCGDPPAGGVALETARRIEALPTATPQPIRTVPLYEFA
jgi:hypothetical protein